MKWISLRELSGNVTTEEGTGKRGEHERVMLENKNFETGSYYVAQAGLLSPEITGMCFHTLQERENSKVT